MFAKRLLQKAIYHSQHDMQRGGLTPEDLDIRVAVHYGIPSTSSILAFDPIQRLLAIGTLDGRIKVIGGGGIEGLLTSANQSPYKYLEFLQNEGYLVSISNDNEIQVWNLESRCLACCLQWESNITAFTIVSGSHFMYIGDEYGFMSVIKFDAENEKLQQFAYRVSAHSICDVAGFPLLDEQLSPIIGVLHHSSSMGNSVLIAYANGLLLLWDVSRGQVLFVGGGKDLQLNNEVESSRKFNSIIPNDTLENSLAEKEISALCWASSNGSILAVGYIDGDILFWKTFSSASDKGQQGSPSSKNVVRLQLSSSEKRLPVIVLHWSGNCRARNGCDGQLFIYGGDEIGSEEVLTVLTIEWSSGMEILRCVGRVELKLCGSFADMILLPNPGVTTGDSPKADLFVLTNPGKLHFYDECRLSGIMDKTDSKSSVFAMEFPQMIPAADLPITTTKLIKLPNEGSSIKILSELALMKLGSTKIQFSSAKWPLTGGLPSQLSTMKDNKVERVYLAGYHDGSIRIWDATYPVFSFICLLDAEVEGVKIAGSCAPVLKLDFCLTTASLAVGNESGLVRIYDLKGGSDEKKFYFVTESKREVHALPQGKQPQYRAVYSLINSPIQALQFSQSGVKLGVGYGSGHIAVLDIPSSSVLFFMEGISESRSPITTMTWGEYNTATYGALKSPRHSGTKVPVNHVAEALFILTKDAKINMIDGNSGNMISPRPLKLKKEANAISMYVIEGGLSVSGSPDEKHTDEPSPNPTATSECIPDSGSAGSNLHESERHSSAETSCSAEKFLDSLVLLCCENSLRLFSVKSMIQGNYKPIRKLKQSKCCWTSTFKNNGRDSGLVLLFQTGVIEIRSLPDLGLLKESSLQSTLMWSFKANMDKIATSSEHGQIVLGNGSEVAFLSLLSNENEFRIPDSLPSLHDKVVAAAADAAFSVSLYQKKNQLPSTGILGTIVKGFKGGKMTSTDDCFSTRESYHAHLEHIFQNPLFSDSSSAVKNNQEVEELSIDDIQIDDEPPPIASTSSKEVKEEKRTERERLFGDGNDDWKPRTRTPEEILATYKFDGDVSLAAAHARNKLHERQEKLEKLSQRTEDLRNDAEDFASLANELVKTMENRKWWRL